MEGEVIVIVLNLCGIKHVLFFFSFLPPPLASSSSFCASSSLTNFLSVPVNRLMTQIACYLMFIVWIILTLVNPSDDPDKVDGNSYDILAAVWALGYILLDVQMMYQVCTYTSNILYCPT